MRPVCIATAAVIAGKQTSTGGLAALVVEEVFPKNVAKFRHFRFSKSSKSEQQISHARREQL
jgi:Na+/H+ antiporter NhaD/arsenite permease-like protein